MMKMFRRLKDFWLSEGRAQIFEFLFDFTGLPEERLRKHVHLEGRLPRVIAIIILNGQKKYRFPNSPFETALRASSGRPEL